MGERYALTVATPWYPTPYNRMAGSFVAEHAALSATIPGIAAGGGVHVVQGLEWPGSTAAGAVTLRPAFDAVLDRLRETGGTRITGVAGPVDRVPVFAVRGAAWAERAEATVRDVRRAVGSFSSPLVHGHVGYLGGLLAARLAEPGAKVFATEHSTALRTVLSEPGAREHYAEVLERADAVFCVSQLLCDQVLEQVPDPSGRLQVLPNPVDFTGVPRRSQPPERLSRWVFVGGLIERKGVTRLVRAFTVAAREDAEVSLTLYGTGALAEDLIQLARSAGVGDRLHLPGVLRHRELLAALPEYDLLLAPSTYETFHLAVPEAVAAGLPVIVTRSGGPQEALAGVEHQVGRFVDVEESPDALIEAWRDLSADLDSLDLDAARDTLNARYGRAAIRARLAEAYGLVTPAPDAVAPAGGAPRCGGAAPAAGRGGGRLRLAALPRGRRTGRRPQAQGAHRGGHRRPADHLLGRRRPGGRAVRGRPGRGDPAPGPDLRPRPARRRPDEAPAAGRPRRLPPARNRRPGRRLPGRRDPRSR